MAQIKTWIDALSSIYLPKAGGAMTGDVTDMGSGSTVKDPGGTARPVGFRNIPTNTQSSAYVLALGDVGKCVDISTGGVSIPTNASVAFAVGDTISIYNNSGSNQTLTAISGVTLRLAGTSTTGNRTLSQRAWATIRKVATNEWVVSGAGVV